MHTRINSMQGSQPNVGSGFSTDRKRYLPENLKRHSMATMKPIRMIMAEEEADNCMNRVATANRLANKRYDVMSLADEIYQKSHYTKKRQIMTKRHLFNKASDLNVLTVRE